MCHIGAAAMRPPGSVPPLAAFRARLRAATSATDCLAEWCAARGIGEGEVAVRRRPPLPAPPPLPLPALLGPAPRHRSVTLYRGAVALSDCDLWWAEARLPRRLRTALAGTDLPFGRLVAPLSPRRRILLERPGAGPHALEVQAVVETDAGPIAVVREYYRATLFAADADAPISGPGRLGPERETP